MFSMAKVTKINYMADDFSKEFVGQQENIRSKLQLINNGTNRTV